MGNTKPFCISKREVWEAYKRVKANQGAAGVDGQSIEQFEADLENNLYRLWNRMCSGSYFPPPVRRVEIPKDDKSTRLLGIPTVCDRIAQTVAKRYLEPILGTAVPWRLVWISAGSVSASSTFSDAATLLALRLSVGSRYQEFLSIPLIGSFCYERCADTPTANGCCCI
jgi:hypothetical protein